MRTFTVYGLIATPDFQRCAEAAEYLNAEYGDMYQVEVVREMPIDFIRRRPQMVLEGQMNSHALEVVVVDEHGKGRTAKDFLSEVQMSTKFHLATVEASHPDSYENGARRAWKTFLRERGNQYCWMDVTKGNAHLGRIYLELYSQVLPRTCNNFRALCRGDAGEVVPDGASEPIHLTYKGTTFFRVLKDAWVMGGDVSAGHTGNGGYSTYGRYFPDESFAIPHDAAGVLGMCNDGAHTNASSFYLTRKRLSWMNGRYVAFGRVTDGMDVVDAIHDAEVQHNQAPCETITISDCGVLDVTM